MTVVETGAERVAWDLTDAYDGPDDPKLEADLQDARTSTAAFATRYRGRIASLSAQELSDAVAELERINGIVGRAGAYAHLLFSTETSDPVRGALVQRLSEESAALETQLVFVRLEWSALADERVAELLSAGFGRIS
jgi:oligoendopeptidase F